MFKIVVDLEATCCENNEFPRTDMEIIEIGAVCLDENGEIRDTFQCFIKPVKQPILTEFCKNLTTIKQEEVDSADTFVNSMNKFLTWVKDVCGKNTFTFMSWGDFDKNIIARQALEHNIDVMFLTSQHLNIKVEFANKFKLKRPCGVWKALKISNMEFEGIQHRALDDAINISRLSNLL